MSDLGQLNYEWALTFLSQLNRSGITDCIISPGSRSTPLVLAASQINSLNKRVVIDERSAAFQALGIAKSTARPVILICTSGTAAANYFPAIVEANLARIPLVVITADRPSKLRNIGAQQTIDQVKLYGNHADYFELGEPNRDDLNRLSVLAHQIMHECMKGKPIHVNAPFRKPLQPQTFQEEIIHFNPAELHFQFPTVDLTDLQNELMVSKRPLFVFGPVSIPTLNFRFVYKWAIDNGIPCISEVLSQTKNTIGFLESFLKQEETQHFLTPDLIVRFGRQPVNATIDHYLKRNKNIPQLHFDYFDVWHDATFTTYQHYFGKIDEAEFLDLNFYANEMWFELWQNIILEKQQSIQTELAQTKPLADGQLFKSITEWNQFDGLHLSNSYPIRDIEVFGMVSDKDVYGNRGANGIDGVISTALGNSVVYHQFCTIIGDIAFLHDASALVNHVQYNANHTIIVINNGGGRIFDMLPVSKSGAHLMTNYFNTPQPYSCEFITKGFGIPYLKATTIEEFNSALNQSYEGIRVIECVTNPKISQQLRETVTKL